MRIELGADSKLRLAGLGTYRIETAEVISKRAVKFLTKKLFKRANKKNRERQLGLKATSDEAYTISFQRPRDGAESDDEKE